MYSGDSLQQERDTENFVRLNEPEYEGNTRNRRNTLNREKSREFSQGIN